VALVVEVVEVVLVEVVLVEVLVVVLAGADPFTAP
jgi:hypothetical protein